MRVLIVRPEPGASATAGRVARAGFEPVAIPLFDVAPVAWVLPQTRFDIVVATSANALRHGGPALQALCQRPLYVVGEATAAAARAAGLDPAVVGDGDADDLARSLPAGVSVLHLCGTERRALPTANAVIEVPVYTLVPRPLGAAGCQALAEADAVLVHAASAGARLADLLSFRSRERLHLVAISARAATASGPGWRLVQVAAAPREDAMLALLAGLCDTKR